MVVHCDIHQQGCLNVLTAWRPHVNCVAQGPVSYGALGNAITWGLSAVSVLNVA